MKNKLKEQMEEKRKKRKKNREGKWKGLRGETKLKKERMKRESNVGNFVFSRFNNFKILG